MGRSAITSTMTFALALAFASLSCRGETDIETSSLTIRVDTVNGAIHVSNVGEGPAWDGVELVHLGSTGGLTAVEQPDEFGQVTGVVASEDGTIYVADEIAREIRVFSADGTFLRRFGREGAGPGEFRAIQSLGMLGDTLVVLDPRNARIGFLSPEGHWLGQRSYARVSGPDIRIFQTGASEFWIPAIESTMQMVYVRHRSDRPYESIPLQPAEPAPNSYVFCQSENAFVYFVPDWAPTLLRVPAPRGHIAEGWSGTYRLTFLDSHGDTVRVVERDQPRLIPTDGEWADQVAQFDSMMAPHPGIRCEPRRPVRPDEKGLIRAAFFDTQGRLWVERRTDTGFALDAFDQSGGLRGTVAIPNRVEAVPIFIRGGRLYLVEEDELGIHSVVVLAVRPNAAG